MKFTTRVFLVALRLVIGWHFLVEGLYKFDAVQPWSSEAYLRESAGPLGPTFRGLGADTVLDKVTVLSAKNDADPNEESDADRFPTALAHEWDAYFARFINYHNLNDPDNERLRGEVEIAFRQAKADYVSFVLNHKRDMPKTSPYSSEKIDVQKTFAERIDDYQQKKEAMAALQDHVLQERHEEGSLPYQQAFKDLTSARQDLARMRGEFQDEVNDKTRVMERTLLDTLEREGALSPDKVLMPQPSRLAWQGWTVKQRNLWFGLWAMTILAGWSFFAILGWTAWQPSSWSPGRWLFWVVWLVAILTGATGITCLLGSQWWLGWRPFVFDLHGLTGWLFSAAGIGLLASFLFVGFGLQDRGQRSKSGSKMDWAACVTILASALWLFAALALLFAPMWIGLNRLEITDGLVTWGLLSIGACLLVGFCTQPTALLGALVVFSFWLAVPPLPWLPAAPNSEGHYLWINKNVIEGVALLVLASTAVGRWAGVDGMLRLLNPRAWRRRTKVQKPKVRQPVVEDVSVDLV